MTTRAIVPNGDGEGSLGTSTAKWGAVYSSDPASGENSGQVPTTAWVQKLVADALAKQKAAYEQAISKAVSDAHPVGSYYWSNDSTSPATLFGGTWEALPPGYTLIAQGSGSDSFGSFTYTAGQKYGERKHQLTTDELPSISGTIGCRNGENGGIFERPATGVFSYQDAEQGLTYETRGDSSGSYVTYSTAKLSFGKNSPHANVQPSVAAYCWKRTA